ncbi:hypothetical protein FOZG_08579 [Fusarium oxysporum Fo47]|uniref:Uncharacterized protein n=1 Tax=Fusarium oxysporum Fo47 TaxID=660027 RepID=W9KDN7_FUSOX|nr:hypothetical protein FOZG_08579 [Fusarium oxysporum Fo47]
MDSPNIFGDRPKSRCPHCNFYPKLGENKPRCSRRYYARSINSGATLHYDDDSFAVRVARAEASIYEEDWSWDCSLAKFKGNTSPEEMV